MSGGRRPGPRVEYPVYRVVDWMGGKPVSPPILDEGQAIATPNQVRVLWPNHINLPGEPGRWHLGTGGEARSPAEAWARRIAYLSERVEVEARRVVEASDRLLEAIALSKTVSR